MSKTLQVLGYTALVALALLLEDKIDQMRPCVDVRVVDVASKGNEEVLLEITDTGSLIPNVFWFGTRTQAQYVMVDNLPENLKQVNARFTCQLKERQQEKKNLPTDKGYHAAKIASVCSQQNTAPVVAAGK